MKILQLIHKIQNRGAETFACQLSNQLLSLGHEIKMVSLYNGEATLPYDQEIIILDEKSSNSPINYRGWKKLAQIIKEFNPDLIQANSGDTLKYAVFSKLIFGWRPFLIFRNASEVGRYLKSPIQKSLNKFLYKNIDWVISVSQASKKDLVSHFPFLKNKIDVIGVGLESFDDQNSREFLPTDKKHIVHVGGFSFEKNHKGLLDIFQRVLKKNSNAHLHLIGDGPLKKEIEILVAEMNLTDNITCYGFVNDSLSYITAADVLVLPSVIEGLPGVILEAMMCKIPVVAFNVGGISEILSEKTGSLIYSGDNSAFSEAILNTLNNTNSNQIESAYNLVTSNFLNSQLALKFVNSYEKLVPTLE